MGRISEFFPSEHSREVLLEVQKRVAGKATAEDDFGELTLVGGADQAFLGESVISGIVVLEYDSLDVVERVYSVKHASFPYIPTFLSFREGHAIVGAFRKLKNKPDILLVDGAGINHPRGAGLATHIGVALDVPTIGVTKRILCGSAKEPLEAGEASPLMYEGKKVGWLLKSNKRSRAIVIAPGNRVSLESSLSIVKKCIRSHKLPEPLRLAHEYANSAKEAYFNP